MLTPDIEVYLTILNKVATLWKQAHMNIGTGNRSPRPPPSLFYVLGHILCTSYIATYVVLAVMQNFHEQKKTKKTLRPSLHTERSQILKVAKLKSHTGVVLASHRQGL